MPSQRGGRLAPRWVHDLYHMTMPELGQKVSESVTTRLNYSGSYDATRHSHDLVLMTKQCTGQNANPRILSLLCRGCDHHFILRTAWDATRQHQLCNAGKEVSDIAKPFPPPQDDYPMHHLVHDGGFSGDECSEHSAARHSPLLSRESYSCSVPDCSLVLSLEIHEPRLTIEWLDILTDTDRLRHRFMDARQSEPGRYPESYEQWIDTGPSLLNTYLRNRLENDERKISKRNRRFQVVFGSEMWPMFVLLGYDEVTLSRDGEEEEFFVPRPLEPVNEGEPTKEGSLRFYIEQMQAEVESWVIRTKGRPDTSNSDIYAREPLERQLHCCHWPRTTPEPGDPSAAEFSLLGVLPSMNPSLIMYAYYRQVYTWPANKHLLAHSLAQVSTRISDDDLQQQAALEISMLEEPQPAQHSEDEDLVWQAYTYFGIDASGIVAEHEITRAFRKKMNQGEDESSAARDFIRILGRHRNSRRLRELADNSHGQMSVVTAYDFLGASQNDGAYMIMRQADEKLNQYPGDEAMREEVSEALLVIGSDRNMGQITEKALELTATTHTNGNVDVWSGHGNPQSVGQVGLTNIGNTCYLNSLLQVLQRVVPIRELIENFEDVQLPLDDDAISARRLGGSQLPISRPEAVVAHVFVEELRNLFNEMETTSLSSVRPTQRLANAVLISDEQIALASKQEGIVQPQEQEQLLPFEQLDTQAAPPLPARPCPSPPGSADVPVQHVEHVEQVQHVENSNAFSVSVNSMSEMSDTASQDSSKTLVDGAMDIDSVVSHTDEKPGEKENTPPDDKILVALTKQKRSSGTDQQDVEEVMGSILNRLQAAIKPEYVRPDRVQIETIMKTFFFEVVNHTKLAQDSGYRPETTLDRSITAYPAENRACTIYEALSRNFDRQTIEDSDIVRYSSIKEPPPPILHVLVQRTKQTGQKNSNPVAVDSMLYLDRYMDAEPESPLFKLRKLSWFLRKRLEQVSSCPKLLNNDDAGLLGRFVDTQVNAPPQETAGEQQASLLTGQPPVKMSFAPELPEFKPFAGTQSPNPGEADDASSLLPVDIPPVEQIEAMAEGKAKAYLDAVEKLFGDDMKRHAYRLHAAICHSGHLNAGHYWVWIQDFEAGVWRKYNDETVTEYASEEEVLGILNRSGDPYYLCYVREDQRNELVREPRREASAVTMDIDLTGRVNGSPGSKNSTTVVDIQVGEEEYFPLVGHPNTPTVVATEPEGPPPTYEESMA